MNDGKAGDRIWDAFLTERDKKVPLLKTEWVRALAR